ncbi:MAG: leucyl aminopeptidase [Gemmatimonadetes bacterium]|nr:leucyl aminopeptidase [Gemmatimonadota bacterium]
MDLSVHTGSLAELATPALVVSVFYDETRTVGPVAAVDRAMGGFLRELLDSGEITGKEGEVTVLHTRGAIAADRIAVVGLGKRATFDLVRARKAAAAAATELLKRKVPAFHSVVHGRGVLGEAPDVLAEATVEGTLLGAYSFDRYKSHAIAEDKERRKATLESFGLVDGARGGARALREGLRRGGLLAEATNYARDLGNAPGNEITPAALADAATTLAREVGLEVEVLGPAEMAERGMGALLAVARGSAQEPRLIVLRHRGGGRQAPYALVGKAITFDSGGISIKPAQNMEEMKFDKCGGCAVLGAMRGVARLELPLNVVGVVPSAENLPSATAYKPGDILTASSGKTIEVVNTDAEGRLILADALTYACGLQPRAIIDFATLTGACVVALGKHCSGVLGNDQGLIDDLVDAGERTGDRAWQLPLWPVYTEQIRSDYADIKNSGGREGGAITAAAFLEAFVDGVPWAHFDIAGTAWRTRPAAEGAVGATGVGVRLILEYLRAQAET